MTQKPIWEKSAKKGLYIASSIHNAGPVGPVVPCALMVGAQGFESPDSRRL